MSRVATAFKATVVLQLFELVALGISLVLVPLYLSKLGQEGYGLFLSGLTWASYLMFSNGGMSAATLILVSQAHGAGKPEDVARILRTSRGLALVASTIAVLVALSLYALLGHAGAARAMNLTHPDAAPLMLVVAAQVVISLNGAPFSDLLVGSLRPQRAALIQGSTRVASQLTMVALLLWGASVWQVFAAGPIWGAVATVLAYASARRALPHAFAAGAWFERDQTVAQLRTGAKSLALHVGSTLTSTAPIFVLTFVGGPALVPMYAVPMRILGLANVVLTSFAGQLQAAFGEAWARRDMPWLRQTATTLLRYTLVANAATLSLLIALGPTLVETWTAGKLRVSTVMVAGVATAGCAMVLVTSLKQVLSGMNRHRVAAMSELASGALAFALCFGAAVSLGHDFIGFGVALAAALTSGVVLPRELRRYLETPRVGPGAVTVAKLGLLGAFAFAAARGLLIALEATSLPALPGLALCGGAAAFVFAAGCHLFGVLDIVAGLRRGRADVGPAR